MVNDKEWHKIGYILTKTLGICRCQRKLKSIIEVLNNILDKNEKGNLGYTGEEYLILALIDSKQSANSYIITHGTNCEYPIIDKDNEFWKWVREIKDSPDLEDN